jgi:hypothetical protein
MRKPKTKRDGNVSTIQRPIRVIISWMCEHCGWMNDNNTGPCRKCKKKSK